MPSAIAASRSKSVRCGWCATCGSRCGSGDGRTKAGVRERHREGFFSAPSRRYGVEQVSEEAKIMEEPPKTAWFRNAAAWLYDAFASPHNTAISIIVILLLGSFIAVDELAHYL